MAHKGPRQLQRATLDAVFGMVRKLYFANKPVPAPATRAQLHAALDLPASTIDDRIRTLVASGRIERPSPGRYKPVMGRCRTSGKVQVSWASGQVELVVRGHAMTMSKDDAREAAERLRHFLSSVATPADDAIPPTPPQRRPARKAK